jgi:hypothetical protein
MIQLPMSVMSPLNFFIYLIFSVSQTYSEKPNFLMFVIFLLTQPSAIFARCGLLPATAIAPSCYPLPPLSPPLPAPPPPAPLPPSSTIEAAHRWCAMPHPTLQPLSAATVHSCCAPSLPAPLLLSSTKPLTIGAPCCIPLHSRLLLPPSTVAVHRCRRHRCCCCPTAAVHPATVHRCCAPFPPPPPLPSSKSTLPQCNVCRSWYFISYKELGWGGGGGGLGERGGG